MAGAMLSTCGLQKQFDADQEPVLKDITVQFEQGSSYAIMGVSGTGKSTLMHLLSGLDQPTHGELLFNGQPLNRMSEAEHTTFLRQSVGLLFQQPYLLRELSVLENVMLPALIINDNKKIAAEKAQQLLESVGLMHKADASPGSLSGGQQQRIALARALMNRPAFLIADEPTGNLDERTAYEMVDLLIALQQRWRMGLIVSTHDQALACRMEHCYRLHDGILQEERDQGAFRAEGMLSKQGG